MRETGPYIGPSVDFNVGDSMSQLGKGAYNAAVAMAADLTGVSAVEGIGNGIQALRDEPLMDLTESLRVENTLQGDIGGAVLLALVTRKLGGGRGGAKAVGTTKTLDVADDAGDVARTCKGGACGGTVCFVEGTVVATGDEFTRIEEIRLGQRVESGNALCANDHVPENALTVRLRMAMSC